jgi:hypothetical protein
MPSATEFKNMFSFPREPETQNGPTRPAELTVAQGRRVVITDIYVRKEDEDPLALHILEQVSPNGFEVRYRFDVESKTTLLSFATGLKLGDLAPIAGSVRVELSRPALVRVNGSFL